MKRGWAVRPDESGTVSREALIGALIDGATMLDLAGGVLSVVVNRAPTGFPGEMVTTLALVEWKDRTDAREHPETEVAVPSEPRREPAPAPADPEPEPEGDEVDPADGFDYSRLQEEDVDEPLTAAP